MPTNIEILHRDLICPHGVLLHTLPKAWVLQQTLLNALTHRLIIERRLRDTHAKNHHQVGFRVRAQPRGVHFAHALLNQRALRLGSAYEESHRGVRSIARMGEG